MKNLLLCLLLFPQILYAQIEISNLSQNTKNNFPMVSGTDLADIYFDSTDFEVVKISSKCLARDIERVTGKIPRIVSTEKQLKNNIIIIGTIGSNTLIDGLISNRKLNVDSIRGQWERFIIKTINSPLPGIRKALVIVGSDRRGTAFGVFSISKSIGVSPWYWWADVPIQKKTELYIKPIEFISNSPSVKYRGIFLNDEDWGLLPWAAKNIDKEINDIGPRTYSKICELMLRLKANYLWPAMHEVTGAFNKYPENRLVADSFGIIMGSSHCEPLLYNNASEWDKNTMGDWNYKTNKKSILDQLEKRVQTNYPYENIYTLGLRGLHDAGMIGNLTQKERVTTLENAINDQQSLLSKYISTPIESIPQILVPYKEVMEIYEEGLNVPDEVTLVWPDDNYGYIKRLSSPGEQKRAGRAGVYYHVSYLGSPHNYLWLSTTPPALMYEEMLKAYQTGADRVWVLNVGDIKACEFSTSLFLDMAWNINSFNYAVLPKYTAKWYSDIFGDEYFNDFLQIWNGYYHLGFIRKPEFMAWGYEWRNKDWYEKISDTKFSYSNYNEAENRLIAYRLIANKVSSIMKKLKNGQKESFFQLVYYPVIGSCYMNFKMLKAQQNHSYAKQGRSKTNNLALESHQYFDSLQIITNTYNSLLNGKWDGMMSLKQGWYSNVHLMPKVDSISLPSKPELAVFGEGYEDNQSIHEASQSLPCFYSFAPKSYYIDIVNKGSNELEWTATSPEKWIVLSQLSGKTTNEQRIFVSVDWDKRPAGELVYGDVTVYSGTQTQKVLISTFQPQNIKTEDLKGLFVEQNGFISIPAADFHHKKESENAKVIIIEGLGIEGKSIQFGDSYLSYNHLNICTDYSFYTFNSGWAKVYIYALPVFPKDASQGAGFAISIDNDITYNMDITAKEYSDTWSENVLRNYALTKSEIFISQSGEHTLKLMSRSKGMVIQKIVIDLGGLRDSYSSPPSSKIN
jgi:hypothetical protein